MQFWTFKTETSLMNCLRFYDLNFDETGTTGNLILHVSGMKNHKLT